MALKVKKLSVKEYGIKMKAAIQSSGKLSFTESTANNLHLDKDTHFALYQDETDAEIMYMVANTDDPDAFPVRRSGIYYYMPTKVLFDMLEVDYVHNTYIFDIIRMAKHDAELGGTVYQMKRRRCDKPAEEEMQEPAATPEE